MSGISSQQKEGSSKTREQGLKTKEVKPHMKSPMLYKKREDEIYMLLEEILSKERKKERRSHIPIVQNPMCGLIHTRTSFAFALPSTP
jgi:hypothetical protein